MNDQLLLRDSSVRISERTKATKQGNSPQLLCEHSTTAHFLKSTVNERQAQQRQLSNTNSTLATVPATFKAYEYQHFGDFLEQIKFNESAEQKPVQPHEVKIKIFSASLNPIDYKIVFFASMILSIMATPSSLASESQPKATGATLLGTPPRRRKGEQTPEQEKVVDLAAVKHVGDLEMVEGDAILDTLLRASTPRVTRRFPSEEALTDSEQRDREVLRRRRLKLRSQYSAMKERQPRDELVQVERNLFQKRDDVKSLLVEKEKVEAVDEERTRLEDEDDETDEETTESKIYRLSKVIHMNWRQFLVWLVSGALLLCAMVVAAPFVKKLLEPPLPYCDSEWIEVNDGSYVLADPADHFDRSKALQPFISSSAMAAHAAGPVCQPCPVYGNCLNGSVISCAPPYELQYGLCAENPKVQENLDQLAFSIQKFVVEKAAKNACDSMSLWTYLVSDSSTDPTNDLTASIKVLLSDVQVFVTRTISFGKAVSKLPRDYVFNRALDMALRDLKDIFVTEDQSQLVVGGGVVPWSCRAKHQLYSNVKLIALAVALGTSLVFGYRQYLLYRTERQLVDRFVKEVRFFLLDRTRRSNRFYPANHLRDDLFQKQSLQERAWLCKSVWPKVVAVIKDDSRISTQLMKLHGEDQIVWQWAPSASPSHRRTGGGRGRGFRAPQRPQRPNGGHSTRPIPAVRQRNNRTNQP
ncbi:unnamed protein product [Phytophthora lilii]|uniref:Unnamed protein product n=1 Tax=Phytophthora lilii TaxID=2077276 RepID=A0A9W6X0U9_9STRA|nr:unnamed protein product [Phytophthora lilii]